MTDTETDPSHNLESEVKSYVRAFPIVVEKAKGEIITDQNGEEYLDFLSGAGTLNYGHNNPEIKECLLEYLKADGLVHGLDMSSTAKNHFIDTFNELILKPRGLKYKLQFCGPTGTNAVEAGLKLARKVTGRTNVMAFTNGFHGMTLGALSVTSNNYHKEGIPATASAHTTFMPYCGYTNNLESSIGFLRDFLRDNSSGVSLPAAMILETVQGEGGINIASKKWLRSLCKLCTEFGILLIVDDIQMGCGRTGDFFSFEEAGIEPDIVLLSKSIGAYGLPMAVVLLKPELDQWEPGQHNGTFRGHNLAFVAAAKALEHYWANNDFSKSIKHKSALLEENLQNIMSAYPELDFEVRGRGLAYGLESKADKSLAQKLSKECFSNKLIIETCGSDSQVLKPLPPLTITEAKLKEGLNIIKSAVKNVLSDQNNRILEAA